MKSGPTGKPLRRTAGPTITAQTKRRECPEWAIYHLSRADVMTSAYHPETAAKARISPSLRDYATFFAATQQFHERPSE